MITRNCIACNSDNYEVLFTYTYDFLVNVREVPAQWLEKIGWDKDIKSTIVECKKCGTKYVRNAFPNWEEQQEEKNEEEIKQSWINHDSYKKYFWRTYEMWVLHNLITLATKKFSRNVKLLDYGAGHGSWCNLARAMGVNEVLAYEPFHPYHPDNYKTYNFPGIVASRSWEEIEKHAPFDMVVCNGAFEHFLNPKEDINRIKENMTQGGYFYINNPVMDLNKELNPLKNADKIVKKMKISHYHPGHLNYLTPKQFNKFIKSFNFKAIKVQPNPMTPPVSLKGNLKRKIKSLLFFTEMFNPDIYIVKKV